MPLRSESTTNNNKLAIIIIAAGNSNRLGTEKQLVMFRSQTLLQNTIDLARHFSANVVCVLGHAAERIKLIHQVNGDHTQFITNNKWQQGMGSSIAIGCKHLCNQENDCSAVMILLCDQYLLQQDDLNQLVRRWEERPGKIVASEYFDEQENKLVCGVPAIFPEQYFHSLKKLKESGAKKILETHQNNRITVPLENAATDLDTKNDLKILLAKEQD